MAKKKKQTYAEFMKEYYGVGDDIAPITTTTKAKDTDIAPVKTTTERKYAKGGSDFDGNNKVSEGNTKKRTWFNTSAFDDGYQLFDGLKSIGATIGDIAENIIVGSGELAERGLEGTTAFLSAMFESQQLQNAATEMAYKEMKGEDSTELLKSRMKPVEAVKEKTAAFVAEDSWNSEKAVKESAKKILGVDLDEYSLMGEKLDSALQSIPQVAASASAEAVGVPWFLVSGMTSYGGELENALNQGGASWEEANLSAGVSASGEILTEMLSGGISFGGKTLDDVLTKQVATKIASKFWQKAAQLGLDVTGEAVEEWISADIGAFGQWLTYRSDEELTELLGSEEAMDAKIEAAIGGGLLGGVSNIGKAVKGKVTGVDSVTGLTKNEQKIFDKVAKDKIAEAEKGGKKLTANEKAKIRSEVMEDLKEGGVSTDTIAEVLGGDSYKAYQDAIEKDNQAIAELEGIYEGEELNKAKEEILKNSERESLKAKMNEDVFKAVKGSNDQFLVESYNEVARKKQDFEADLTKYDEKQRKVIKNAIDAGILNNTNRTHKLVDWIAKISADKGIDFDFANNKKLQELGYAVEGKTVNGVEDNGKITLNLESAKAISSTVGHELTHVLEGTELYDSLQETLFKYAKVKGEYETRLREAMDLYKGVKGYEGADGFAKIKKEVAADLVGDYLFTDKDFVRKLHAENRNVFQKVWDEIKYLYKIATAGSQEARQLAKVQKAFEDVYRESVNVKTEAKGEAKGKATYSLSDAKIPTKDDIIKKDPIKVVDISTPQTEGTFAVRRKKIRENAKGVISKPYLNSDTNSLIFLTNDSYTHAFNNLGELQLNAAEHLPELIENAVLTHAEKPTHGSEFASGVYTFFAAAKTADGIRPVKLKVKEYVYSGQDLPKNIKEYFENSPQGYAASYDTVVLAVEGIEENPSGSVKDMTKKEPFLDPAGFLTYKVADLLDLVKGESEKYLPKFSLSTDSNSKQTDNAYLSAVEKGDIETAQRMVDEAAKNAGYTYKAYHGSRYEFNVFSKEKRGSNTRTEVSKKWFFAADKETANSYYPYGVIEALQGKETAEKLKNKGKLYDLYIKMENPLVVDVADYDYAAHRENADAWMEYVQQAEENGNDGIILLNALDNQLKTSARESTVYMFKDSSQAKSADPITKDDNGNVIPLSQRFNAEKDDIRHSLSEENAPTKQYGDFNTPANEMLLERDIAPTKADLAKRADDIAPVYNVPESAPMTEEDAEAMARESLANITDAEAPDIVADDGTVPRETTQLPKTKVAEIAKHIREKLGLSNRQMSIARGLIEEYSKNDALSRDDLYQTIKAAFGTQTKADDYVALRNEAREFIRNLKINVPKEMQSDIPDFDKKRRSMARKIKFSEDGQGIDALYKNDLQPNFPKLFGDETQGDAEKFDELYDVLTNDGTEEVDLPDETLQSAADIIVNEVTDYRQKWTQKLAESASRQPIDQSQIPVTAEEYNARVDKLYDSLSTKPIDRLQKAGAYTFLIRRGDDGSAYFVIQKNGVGIRKRIEDASNMSDAQLWRYASEMAVDTEMPYQMEESVEVKEYDPQKEKLERSLRSIDKHLETDKKLLDEEFEIRRQDAQSEYDNYALDEEYKSRLKELEDTAQTKRQNAKIANQRMTKQEQISNKVKELVGDMSTWVDKKLGLSYKTNTLRRNLRDVVRDSNGKKDIARADAIYDYLQGTYNVNEAKMNRELARIKKAYADMKISKAESTYIQMLGEFRHNPETTLTKEQVEDYLKKHKNSIDEKKVDKAIEMARQTYDSLLERVNATLRENGMREIPYRKGYFPHFNEQKQGLGAKFLEKVLNWKTQNDDIPTSIAGLTEQFNPNRSWQSFNKQRKGDTTDYNFLKGMDNYAFGALDWIYHIEDIERRRALENHIRFTHSDEGIQQQIEKIRANEELDADEVQEQIDLVYANANNPLNNFVTDLRAGTNRLANKKSSLDRNVEEMVNRKVYSNLTNISNRVSANMVAGSISSALTNFIPITQSWAEVDPMYSAIAMGDTIKSIVYDDGTVDKSAFLTNRLRQVDNLYQTGWDKAGKVVGFMMEAVDSFTSQVVWRSKYRSNIASGMSENQAIKNADQFAENVMAGRSRGNNPTIFDSKNLLFKTLTAFQLEVNNQYGYMFKDLPQDVKNKSTYNLVKGYTMMFLGAYAYNALYSMLTGRDAAFDPIGIVQDLLQDLGIGDDDEEDEEIDAVGAVVNFAENVAQEVPFVGGLLGGGRIPLSSAIPYDGNIMDLVEGTASAVSNVWSGIGESKSLSEIWSDADVKKATDEWLLKPLYYLVSPMGGGQLKKTVEGLKMFNTDEDHPIAGSYTNSGDLRFPVDDTFGNRVKAGVFGQYSSKNAREYFDNNYAPLNPKQVKEYMDLDAPIADYWKYREGLKRLKKLEEKADYINGLDFTTEQKNLLINNIADRKEDIDMTDYDAYDGFEEFDYAHKNPEKYAISTAVGGYESFKGYTKTLNGIKGDKDKNGDTISGSRKKKVTAYIQSLDIDRGQKLILHKSEYPSDTQYNREIIAYLKSRNDLSDADRKKILEALGFKVEGNKVRW